MGSVLIGIDIGSTKVCAIIAEKKEGAVTIMGTGIARSQGLKKGSVTNIEQAAKSIRQALSDAKRVAGIEANRAIVSISGTYTKSLNSYGVVNVPSKEIGLKEINRAIQAALYNANIPSDYELIHALPYNFRVDDQDFIEDPAGMSGSRLEVSIHIIATQKSSLENLTKTIRLAGIEIENIVLSSYASSIAVLGDDEKELGVAVIDIGGSTSNLAIHLGNSLRYTDFVAIGSNHITSDLSMALHTPLQIAEKIKIDYGSLHGNSNELIEIPMIGDDQATQQVSLEIVSNVIYARVEETLMILAKSLEKSGFKNALGAGVVLTGGMTKLDGLRELAQAVFDNLPVRIARPREMEGLFESLRDPSYATALGLVLYGLGEHALYEIDSNRRIRPRASDENYAATAALESGEFSPYRSSQEETLPQNRGHQQREEESAPTLKPVNGRQDEGLLSGFEKFWNWLKHLF
ncbi:MAG: cell division protein FtsA [Campylobacterales bacterium]